MSEREVKAACQAVLEQLGWQPTRVNAGGYRGRSRGAPKGTPDLFATIPPNGRALAVETKASHKDSCGCSSCTAQRAWRQRFNALGGLYLQVRSAEELTAALRPLLARAA